jgi:hypothetical protein
MARAAVIKPKKKKTVRASRRVHGFALMPTDSFWRAKHFVHYEIESKDWGVQVKEYIKANFDRKVVANINKLPDWKTSNFSHWATTAYLLKTKPEIVPENYKTKFIEYIQKLSEEGQAKVDAKAEAENDEEKEVVAKPKSTYVPTIQERIQMQVEDALEAIEEWLEGFLKDKENFDPKGFDFTAHFAKHKITQAHARKIMKVYEGELEEAHLIVNMPTPQAIAKIKDEREKDFAQQLREGYRHLSKKDAQNYLTALETLTGACALVLDASKAARKPRAKKAPSKEKVIAKLKYKASDDKLQIASVNPLELLQSTEVWVYNTKTRKLGRYIAAEDASVMTVNGTTLVGFDEEKSIQKTLRKPEVQLKEFKSLGKVKLRTYLDTIATTDTKLNGRINEDTIILRVSQ